jgi:predicted dehydrogenase
MATASPIDAVLIGAGERGTFSYGDNALAHPGHLRFVAVAEPDPERRARFARRHRLPPDRCFETWEDLIAAGQLAPAMLCCTLDRLHVAPTIAALEAGYHVLLEKPMAITPEECVRLVRAGEGADRLLMICHVLRYAPFFSTLHRVISSGRLGEIVAVEHRENVAYWHMAHSYVRGNWRSAAQAGPMILTKCCHDLDLLVWMMAGNPVVRLSSSGSLFHFRPENAPPGAPPRCTDGCPAADVCPFYAPRLYLTDDTGWPTETISVDLSHEGRLHALQTGPYGRCVYDVDNDVVDHQAVTLEHASGAVTTLIMHGHSDKEERTMRYDGTRATLRGKFSFSDASSITLADHGSGVVEHVPLHESHESRHGGGDLGVLVAFVQAVREAGAGTLTAARTSLESHLLAFAAERARVTGKPVDMASFREEYPLTPS